MTENRRKNNKIRGGIRVKIAMSLFLVFFVCGILVFVMMKNQIEKRFKDDISGDMSQIWQNANTYSMQLMIVNHCNNDENGFKEINDILIQSLKTEKMNRIYTYDIAGGSFHNLTDDGLAQKVFHKKSIFSMLMEARDGNAAYMLYRGDNDTCEVRFVFPVRVADKIVGIMAVDQDYSDANKANSELILSTLKIMIGSFGTIFVITWILLGRWLKPLRILSDYSQDLSVAIENQPDMEFPELKSAMTKRKDEIGVLAKDYVSVSDTIDMQFRKIENDRKKILELMEDKQLFFNNVTHELKTPLTTIMGYSQLISEDTTGDKELLEKGMKHINSESERLYQMVIQLLEFAKVQTERELKQISLSNVLMEVISSMKLRLQEEKRDFVVENMAKVSILGDEYELVQLYTNLIDNAIKYGKEETPIMLSIKEEEDCVVSRIGNIGDPIPKEKIGHIFEPFYRIDKTFSREHGSAGLGLSICRKIMEHHGGGISVESDESGIICFCMTFPKVGEAQ